MEMFDTYEFLFEDQETGEQFFIEIDAGIPLKIASVKAKKIAEEYFEEPVSLGVHDYEYAEALGYDTY